MLKKLNLKALFVVALSVLSFPSFGGIERYVNRLEGGTSVVNGASFSVYDGRYGDMLQLNWPTKFTNKSVKNYLRLGQREDMVQDETYTSLDGKITVQLDYYLWGSSGLYSIGSNLVELAISGNVNSQSLIDDISTYSFTGAHYIKATITSISASLNPDLIYLETGIEVERYYAFNNQSLSGSGYTLITSSNELDLHWAVVPGAESYELEYVYINNYDLSSTSSISSSQLNYNFYLNSTRIETRNTSYRVPYTYDKGYFIFRVRAVGRKGPAFTDRDDGLWNAPESGTISGFMVSNPTQYHTITNEFNARTLPSASVKWMNWSHQVVFSEEGKRFDGMSFGDGLGRGRQQVGMNPETGQVIVSNVYYDEMGRAVVSDLPTPVANDYMHYFMNFNLSSQDNSPYCWEVFDGAGSTATCPVSSGFSSTSGAGKYYSSANSNQDGSNGMIPDAESYPFTRMTYMNDFTGRVSKVSEAGAAHKMGSGHETQYYYESPDQSELNAIFGVEVGDKSHYTKITTRDANGQLYVQYMDMAGRVVATYMKGKSPEGLDGLTENSPIDITRELLAVGGLQSISNLPPSAEVVSSFVAEYAGSYTLNYGFTPSQYTATCLPATICLDCVYDLTLRITNECSGEVLNHTVTINGSNFDGLCNGTFSGYSQEVSLLPGNYTVSKQLTVNQSSIASYWCLYLENATCLTSLEDRFNSSYAAEPFADCAPVTYIDNQNLDECASYKSLMLLDLQPGGQYALYTTDANGLYSSTDPWSIFTANNGLGINWMVPPSPYLDANGNNVTSAVTSQGLNYFIDNFRPEWASIFLNSHPEHCHLDFCESNGASQAYDASFLAVNSYDVAVSLGYFKPIPTDNSSFGLLCKDFYLDIKYPSISAVDPFFAAGGLGANYANQALTSMQTAITLDFNGSAITLTMWQYAYYLAMGCDQTPSINPLDCIRGSGDCFGCNKDLIWLKFRELYAAMKARFVLEIQDSTAHANCPGSGCIGVPLSQSGCTGNNASLSTKVPNFTNMNQYAGLLTGNFGSIYTDVQSDQCQTICEDFADEWLANLSNCNFSASDTTGLHADLVALCSSGCTPEHPLASSTTPPGSTLPFHTIDEVLAYHNVDITTLCTGMLITEPGPYQTTEESLELLVQPLDVCGCDYYMDQRLAYNSALSSNTVPAGIVDLEGWIGYHTGENIDDVHQILCSCDKVYTAGGWPSNANTTLAATGVQILANRSCPREDLCIGCNELNTSITTMASLLGNISTSQLETSPNFELLLTNYMNQTYGFQLSSSDYISFLNKCRSSSSSPYCESNPLGNEWIKQLGLLAIRGQLTNQTNLNLVTENIVYKEGELRNSGLGNLFSSSQSGSTLTLSYSGSGYTSCSISLELPVGSPIAFEDIVYFENLTPLTSGCGDQYAFTCDAVYYNCGVRAALTLTGSSSCFSVSTCYCESTGLTLCYDPFAVSHTECYEPRLGQLIDEAFASYATDISELYVDFQSDYNTKCSAAFATEHMAMGGKTSQYQYTLYYYDQAGNLARTVAPEGVHKLSVSDNALIDGARGGVTSMSNYPTPTSQTKPSHDFVTVYNYNSYNQLVSTTNPDQEGATNFYYDRYGRMVLSQNPVQALPTENKYSYVLFDAQGRPVESGQVVPATVYSETVLKADDQGAGFKAWVEAGVRSEVTRTTYDKVLHTTVAGKFATGTQDNLRLRVASVAYYKTYSTSTLWNAYESAIHYSYDIHGNVKEQLQDIPSMSVVAQDVKSTQYEYELISGNVKKVAYQKGKKDQMTHRYEYDKANRLRDAYTSIDGVHEEHQVTYRYYDYGPLARVELGESKVQSMDYVYTINGWLKGMNSSTLDNTRDVGRDGALGYYSGNNRAHFDNAVDVLGYTLGYFDGDYRSVSNASGFEAAYSATPFGSGSGNLYNGNIRHLVTSIVGMETMGSVYKYDQLNRLKEMQTYFNTTGLAQTNSWIGASSSQAYYNNYDYDRNGNFMHLKRNGPASNLNMDDMTYYYTMVGSNLSNRLHKVSDTYSSTYGDIQSGMGNNNYGYTKLGELESDASEGIQRITWRRGDKKVLKIERNDPNGSEMEFIYNPFGQRVVKIERPRVAGNYTSTDNWKYTYYTYDANGQVMAVYAVTNGTTTKKAELNEQHIYGASRLGMKERTQVVLWNNGAVAYTPGATQVHTAGETRYEIANYLGNVNAVVTDRKAISLNYVKNSFKTSGNTEGWTATGATLSIASRYLRVTPSVTGSSTQKTYTTVAGKRYFVRIKSDKGSGPALLVNIPTLGWVNLTHAQSDVYAFTATGASSQIVVRQGSSSTVPYYLDQVELIEDHLYEATAVMSADYYPFGMTMPGRNTNNDAYRFAYNGMEQDNEVKGNGNSYTTEFRQYDPRLGRWLSVDPLAGQMPWFSPYIGMDNNPILLNDPSGLKTDDWVKLPNGHVEYSSTATTNAQAEDEFGTGAYILPEGHTYSSSAGTVVLGKGDNFTINGKSCVAKDLSPYKSTPDTPNEEPLEPTVGNSGLTQSEIDATFNPEKKIVIGTIQEGLAEQISDQTESQLKRENDKRALDNFCRGLDNLKMGSMMLLCAPLVLELAPAMGTGLTSLGNSALYSNATLGTYLSAESAVSATVTTMSRYWLGRVTLTGLSVYSGSNLYNLRTGGTPMPRRPITDPSTKTLVKASFLKVDDRYITGYIREQYRFQIHQHSINGSEKVPHINFGKDGNWHFMLNSKGAQINGWLWRAKSK